MQTVLDMTPMVNTDTGAARMYLPESVVGIYVRDYGLKKVRTYHTVGCRVQLPPLELQLLDLNKKPVRLSVPGRFLVGPPLGDGR